MPITTRMTMVAPASTGLGVIVADCTTGTEVSSVTVLVTLLLLPAASVAVTTMVLEPLAKVTALVKLPLPPTLTAPWSTPLSRTVTVTGLDVASLVTPLTFSAEAAVISPSVGAVSYTHLTLPTKA